MYAQKFQTLVHEEQLVCLTASIHEAGHALAAYFVGWRVDNIRLEIDQQNLLKFGATAYIKDEDDKIVETVLHYQAQPELYESLTDDEKENIPSVIDKRIAVLISGPVTEVRH